MAGSPQVLRSRVVSLAAVKEHFLSVVGCLSLPAALAARRREGSGRGQSLAGVGASGWRRGDGSADPKVAEAVGGAHAFARSGESRRVERSARGREAGVVRRSGDCGGAHLRTHGSGRRAGLFGGRSRYMDSRTTRDSWDY